GFRDVAPQLEPAASRERRRDPRVGLLHAGSLRVDLQFTDDLRRNPPDVDARARFLARVDDEHAAARPREIVRGDEAIHVRPGYDGVPPPSFAALRRPLEWRAPRDVPTRP